MVNIVVKRVNEIEVIFCRIKYILKGNIEGNVVELDKEIDIFVMKVYKDVMVFDGVVLIDDLDDLGMRVFGNE